MKKWMVLIILSMSMFIIVIDTTIMNVSISALVEDLNTTVGGIQSAISLYALVMASFMLIGGKLADIIGKKRTFLIGVVIFGVGTSGAALSQSLTHLFIFWSITEGLGSALMLPNVQTLLRSAYDGSERAFAYGIISAVGAVGAAVGPIVGGFLTTFFTWRLAFAFEVAIVLTVLFLSKHIAADEPITNRPKFDFGGALLSIFGLSAIVLGILSGQQYGYGRAKQAFVFGPWELAPFGLSIVPFMIGLGILLIMLLFSWERQLERQGGDGLFKPSIFKTPGLVSGFTVRFLQMGVTAAFLFIVPLLLQLTFEFTAIQTGIALVPFSIALLIFAILGSKMASRFIAKWIIMAGFVLSTAGLIVMVGTITPDVTPSDMATGVLFGMGIGLIASQILNLVLSSVEAEQIAEASGLNGTFEQLGNALGVALVGSMMLGMLTLSVQDGINNSVVIPDEHKANLIMAAEAGVELMSNSQVDAGLEAVGADVPMRDELLSIYALARTEAFQAGMVFLIFVSLMGLIMSTHLSKRKLVEEGNP